MKFKDNFMYKLYEFKKANNFFKNDSFTEVGRVPIFKYDIGICLMLEQLQELIFKEVEQINIKDSNSDESYFSNAEEALEFLKNKDVSEVESVLIIEYGEDNTRNSSYLLDLEKQVVKILKFDLPSFSSKLNF